MGYYIQTAVNKGKAQQLVDSYGAEIVPGEHLVFVAIPSDKALVCVVENGLFDAAAYCFSEQEYQAFLYPDGRPRTWLLMDRKSVVRLSGYPEGE